MRPKLAPTICAVDGCGRTNGMAAGYCAGHYTRVRKYGNPLADTPLKPYRKHVGQPCAVEGCERVAQAKDWCRQHYQRWLMKGDVLANVPIAERKPPRACRIDGCQKPTRRKELCQMHGERLRRHGAAEWEPAPFVAKPVSAGQGYVQVRVDGKYVREHRYVWEQAHGPLLPGQNIHHKNGDKLDNRLENLEVWDYTQPCGQRPGDKVEFAVEMLRRYAPHLLSQSTQEAA